MGRYLPALRVFSLILLIFGITMLLPVVAAVLGHDGAEFAFDEAILITLGAALLLRLATHRATMELHPRDGFLLVVMAWTVLPVFAAIPLLIFFWPTLSFTDAYFEAAAALTTTGATVLDGLDGLPYSINLWRAELQWLGGMGLIVLVVAILPLLGVGGRQMFRAEAPGPMKESKLTPRMAETAKGLWLVYVALSAACLLALRWAGMGWGDALIHAFTTLSLGGFSSHDASYGYFDSSRIELVTIGFMLAGGINFSTHFMAWRGRTLRPYRLDPEVRWFLAITLGSVAGIGLFLWQSDTYAEFWVAMRHAAFNVVSIATTTGFASTDYNLWPVFAPMWMLFLCSFVTCSGSTGGGLKMMRALVLYKQVFRELTRALHPNVVYPVKVGGEPVPPHIIFAVLAFGFIYMVVLVSLTLAMSFTGLDIMTAFSAVVTSVNNTGPGLVQVGPLKTYRVLTDFQTWICTLGMLLGRLEIFTLLVVLTPHFWRK